MHIRREFKIHVFACCMLLLAIVYLRYRLILFFAKSVWGCFNLQNTCSAFLILIQWIH